MLANQSTDSLGTFSSSKCVLEIIYNCPSPIYEWALNTYLYRRSAILIQHVRWVCWIRKPSKWSLIPKDLYFSITKNGNSSTVIMSKIFANNGKSFSCHPICTNSHRWYSSPYILIQFGLQNMKIEARWHFPWMIYV